MLGPAGFWPISVAAEGLADQQFHAEITALAAATVVFDMITLLARRGRK
jgi:hypothetical protein